MTTAGHRGARRFIPLLDTGHDYQFAIWDVQSNRPRMHYATEDLCREACKHWNRHWNN